MPIDFVITWVNPDDDAWKQAFLKYKSKEKHTQQNDAVRYRDWDNLRYWFRAVEHNAPWVNKIHFVTCNQIPKWLNVDHPKINIVNHKDFIAKNFLPTFSINPIELNFHRIKGLQENFVFFNDDMFVNSNVKKQDFFVEGLPCYQYYLTPACKSKNLIQFYSIVNNDIDAINRHFSVKLPLLSNFNRVFNVRYGCKCNAVNLYLYLLKKESWYYFYHCPTPLRKKTMEEVWMLENDIMLNTSKNKFRTAKDVNQYIFSYWELAKGSFYPYRYSWSYYDVNTRNLHLCKKDILKGKKKVLCLNDNDKCDNFEVCKNEIINVFNKRYPKKSTFEK